MRVSGRPIRTVAGGLTAALILTTSAVPGVGPARASAERPVAHRRTVTLITGDRVTLYPGGNVAIERGEGRAGMTFLAHRAGGHHHVIPADALDLLRQGRLDRRLFDVTALLDFGYDDRRADLPLIVTYAGSAAAARATTAGARITRDLPAIDGLAVRAARTTAFWRGLATARTVRKVWLDGLRTVRLDATVPQVGAPRAWQAGYDGSGQTVAVLDTGIDATHPDLAGRVIGAANFTDEEHRDLVGHGTHVASIVAGSGAAAQGRYTGVAPGARLLDGKVCTGEDCADSAILAGMQWAAEQGAAVVNLSLGGADTPELDPVEAAVQTLTARYGVLFVISAGNDGPGGRTVASPASADAALAVGAVTKADELADFSSRGPRMGDGAVKPEITAPGVGVIAARSNDGTIGEPDGAYTMASGTSMAAPHVAGAAAILAQRHPDWGPDRLKAVLMASAAPGAGPGVHEQGAGRLDVARAVRQAVVPSPPSISFGTQRWPHTDDQPIARTVTYVNDGPAATTLSLALHVTGPGGGPAPAGMFRLDRSTLTVPAGGRADVTVTADTRVGTIDGLAGGRLTATAGDTIVQTPLLVEREAEAHDLTLVHTDRAGRPAARYSTVVLRSDGAAAYVVEDPAGTATLRLPRARYVVVSRILGEAPRAASLLAQPRLDLTRSQTVSLDARQGKPIAVSVPHASARPAVVAVDAIYTRPGFVYGTSIVADRFDGLYTAQVGPDRAMDGFWTHIDVLLGEPGAAGTFEDSPYAYPLSWFVEGRLGTGFERRLRNQDLATVRAEHAEQATGVLGRKIAMAGLPDVFAAGGYMVDMLFRLPFTRTEYYNTDGGIEWHRVLDEAYFGFPVTRTFATPARYARGRSYTERWNRAVIGPTLAAPPDQVWAARQGDQMSFFQPTFVDRDGRETLTTTRSELIRLFRDDEFVDQFAGTRAVFDVPAAAGRYRLEVMAERIAPATLSTAISVAWTFRSGHVPGAEPRRLPLAAVRFTPNLDARNAAPAGRRFGIPVAVVAQPGSGAGGNRSLTVDVSYDDGQTWQRARLTTSSGVRTAWVDHPAAAGFVSLRATAADTKGNTVTQTVIRAYRTV